MIFAVSILAFSVLAVMIHIRMADVEARLEEVEKTLHENGVYR